jgi:hypothetical protein
VFTIEKDHIMRKITKAAIGMATAALLVGGFSSVAANATPATSVSHSAATKSIPAPAASIPALSGSDTAVALDKGFTDALTSLGLTPATVGSATLTDGSIHFPITGGSVTYWSPKSHYRPYVQGIILHTGSGLSLTAGSTVVALTDFTINPGNSKLYGDVSVNGTVAVSQAPLFDLHGATLKPLQVDGNHAILQGTTVHVSSAAADLLNKTFNTDAVKAGLLVGVATITANLK